MKRLTTVLLRALLVLLVLAAVGALWAYVAWREHVVKNPGPHISHEAILAIIAQESPVLYSDRQTRIGVFFAQEHRQYVPYEEIPKAWVDAIVSAEDQRFFQHHGVDPKGLGRAMRDNLKAGKVVAGGSTLTQQTAKNLYYRPDRSARSKWEELVNALRLEAHHSKEEILEYYANQFHVSANGRGLGIAARYFFNKEVAELNVLECAFLAGMVKAPANYNPFIGNTVERREAALARATVRTRYVLDRMLATGAIDAATHAELVARELPFQRGVFRYDTHVLLDEVEARLQQEPFPALFASLGIDNPSTSGIQIVTTVDADLQRAATHALWSHLAEVGPMLDGGSESWRGAESFRLPAPTSPPVQEREPLARWSFHTARVSASSAEPTPSLMLDIGGRSCRVDGAGVSRVASIVARARRGERRASARAEDLQAVWEALPAGSWVEASVRTPATGDQPATCDLHLRPELQGALIALEDGQIRAMVGGNDNRNFNRAVAAQRQFGSTWKTPLYAAALELGWLPTDLLDNRPGQVFLFEGSSWQPRADHVAPERVSLSWAGAKSENVATIWLLAHLLDRLDDETALKLAASVDLVPRSGEAREAWIERIRDDWGVIATEERLEVVAYHAARHELMAELRAAGRELEALELSSLAHGGGASAQEARLKGQRGSEPALAALRFNHRRLSELAPRCDTQARRLHQAMAEGVPPRPDEVDLLQVRPVAGTIELACGQAASGFAPVGASFFEAITDGSTLTLAPPESLLLDGRLSPALLQQLDRMIARRSLVVQGADPWSVERLLHHPDYRLLLSMRTLARFAERAGIRQEMPPVLSMPLGAVELSLADAAAMYAMLLKGQTWSFPGELHSSGLGGLGGPEQLGSAGDELLIAEILDHDGQVLYRARPEPVDRLEPEVGRLTGDILRNVVRWGTGRSGAAAVTMQGQPVPVAGKTGTTNSNRNVAFFGFVPKVATGPDGPVWRWGSGYTLAVYVGYDDNRPMRRGGSSLQGASGSLPPWLATAQAMADLGLLGAQAPASPEWELGEGYTAVAVDAATGLPAEGGEASVLVAVERSFWGGGDEPRRIVTVPEPVAAPAAPPAGPPAGEGEPGLPEVETPPSTPPEEPGTVPTGPGEAAPPVPATGSGEEPGTGEPAVVDPIQDWLGDLLVAPPGYVSGEGGDIVGEGEAPPAEPAAVDTGGIDPRIGPEAPAPAAR